MNWGLWQVVAAFLVTLDSRAVAYTALPRWGQAVSIINDALFIQGGLTDQYNAYSYTTAPINDDLLYLSLSSSFDPSSPPWQLLSSSSNTSTSAGPPVAWHTISATNTSEIFLFGGLPAINSPTVLTVQPDSAWLLNVYNRLVPSWTQEAQSWANEPIRRMRHSAVTNIDGNVFIIGGEKADDSGLTFSDHYIFNPSSPSFSQLPSDNGPPGITGHNSVILPNGTMFVLGGYNPSTNSMVNMSTIWTLDTKASVYEWNSIVAQGTIPSSRRAFVAVLVDGGQKILIHGGCDAHFQTTYSDGYILDLTMNPPTWSQVTALSQIGQRRDHFGVAYGTDVIFGFGYGASGPASASLIVYHPSGDGSFSPTYSAPSLTSISYTQTIPQATQTIPGTGSGASGIPISTSSPGDGGSGSNPASNNDGGDNKKTTGLAVGTALGILSLLVAGVVAIYYVRRRRFVAAQEVRFMLLNEDDPEAGVPAIRTSGEKGPYGERWNVLKNLKVGGALTAAPGGVVGLTQTRQTIARRDMLADEDTRDFGPWYGRRKRDGSGDSSWSLMSFIKMRREGSTSSYASVGTPHREKSDPFSDGAALLRDEETGFVGAAARGHGGSVNRPTHARGMSYTSTLSATSYPDQEMGYSGSAAYRDPFDDPFADQYAIAEVQPAASSSRRPIPRPNQPPQIQTMLPLQVHTLSPVTEASRGTHSQSDYTSSVSSHSHEMGLSPFNTLSQGTSHTSFSPRPSSLLDANNFNEGPSVRRSDSWWSKFSRSSLLDRRGSGSRPQRGGGILDIKDPNPPPRLGGLVAIEESQHSASPEESPDSNLSNSIKRALSRGGGGSRVYKGKHGKSLSSLRTADSDAIERMADGVDVVQRERTGSHHTRGSLGSYDSVGWLPENGQGSVQDVDMSILDVASPVAMAPGESVMIPPGHPTSPSSKAKSPAITPPPSQPSTASSSNTSIDTDGGARPARALTGSTVAARVQAYEKRMSQDHFVPSPTNTRQHEERLHHNGNGKKPQVNYGLAARPNLFIANPDQRYGFSSQDSNS